MKKKKYLKRILCLLLGVILALGATEAESIYEALRGNQHLDLVSEDKDTKDSDTDYRPRIYDDSYLARDYEYEGEPYIIVDDNNTDALDLTEDEMNHFMNFCNSETFTSMLGEDLKRPTCSSWLLSKDTMPTEERGSIGHIKPVGWQTVKYDIVDGKYLYNRCHLTGWQLAGDNSEKNLITGTRYLNVEGMLPFENMVADYLKETGNHVYYYVRPVYKGEHDMLCSGVHIMARSIEDLGVGISINVYCFNVQPGVKIDYSVGRSALLEGN